MLHRLNPISRHLSAKWLRKLSGQNLLLPFYHAVSDVPLPHIQHLYAGKNRKQFIEDLDFLLSLYEPLDVGQLQAVVQNKRPLRKPAFLLSFDDGLREFGEVIAPILRKKGIPAICFLNSAFVDNQALFYRYQVSLLIERLIQEPHWLKEAKVQAWFQARASDTAHFQEVLLGISYQGKDSLEELASLIELDVAAFLGEKRPYLDKQEIGRLMEQGFAFGAHSVDHPWYHQLTLPEQVRQTQASLDFVEAEVLSARRTFSFPFSDEGVSQQFFQEMQENHGLELSFGTAGPKREKFPTHFQRIPFEVDALSGREIHNAAYLYYLLKAPFGKNLIHRP